MSEKRISTNELVTNGKPGDVYLSKHGVTVTIVSVKGKDSNEIRYQRSYPANSAPISKALFKEFFKFQTFEKQSTTNKEVKP